MGLLIFIAGLLVLAYTLALYPLSVWILARRRPDHAAPDGAWPSVTLLIPIYNEEAVVLEKAANSLALQYPGELEILFASDGSTDGGAARLRGLDDRRLRILEYPQNEGKVATLNKAVAAARGEILVLTDASGQLNPEALLRMLPHFRDPAIGCVCGMYHIIRRDRSEIDSAEHSYHSMEIRLRLWEGRIRTTLSGTGALCAFRRAEFAPLPPHLINDDYIIPARIALGGQRVIYEPGAHIHDHITTRMAQAFRRRVRIAYGNWQQLVFLRALLHPARGYLAWVFYSHKVLRMALPLVLLALWAASFGVAPTLGWVLLAGFAGTLALGLLGMALDRHFPERNPLAFVALVYLNLLATMAGTCRFFRGQKVKW